MRKGKLKRRQGRREGKSGREIGEGVKQQGLVHGSSTGDGARGRSEMGMGGQWLGGSGRRTDGEG